MHLARPIIIFFQYQEASLLGVRSCRRCVILEAKKGTSLPVRVRHTLVVGGCGGRLGCGGFCRGFCAFFLILLIFFFFVLFHGRQFGSLL